MNNELNILGPIREGFAISFHRLLNIAGIYLAWWAGFGMAWLRTHQKTWKINAPVRPKWNDGYVHIAYHSGYGCMIWRFMTKEMPSWRRFPPILDYVFDESRRLRCN